MRRHVIRSKTDLSTHGFFFYDVKFSSATAKKNTKKKNRATDQTPLKSAVINTMHRLPALFAEYPGDLHVYDL